MRRLEKSLVKKTEELARVTEERNELARKLETEKKDNMKCVSTLQHMASCKSPYCILNCSIISGYVLLMQNTVGLDG